MELVGFIDLNSRAQEIRLANLVQGNILAKTVTNNILVFRNGRANSSRVLQLIVAVMA